MALFVKILLGTGILGICALAYVANLQQGVAVSAIADATSTHVALDTAKTDLTKVQKEADEEKAQITDANSKLDQAAQESAALKGQLSEAKDKVSGLQKDLDAKNSEYTDAKSHLDALVQDLGSDTIEGLRTKATALAQTLAQDSTERKILIDSLEKAKNSMSKLQALIQNVNNQIYTMPPLHGTVKFVDHTWNFVVLDVGTLQGVSPKGELNIYRGSSYLGKLKISSADTDSSVADIEPDVKGPVEVGDDVVSQ